MLVNILGPIPGYWDYQPTTKIINPVWCKWSACTEWSNSSYSCTGFIKISLFSNFSVFQSCTTPRPHPMVHVSSPNVLTTTKYALDQVFISVARFMIDVHYGDSMSVTWLYFKAVDMINSLEHDTLFLSNKWCKHIYQKHLGYLKIITFDY